jgi:putative glycosyltransferase (TIGR04348 family)
MTRILIVTQARPGSRTGNRETAGRWAMLLRSAGHRVAVATEWQGEPCDLLVALHAHYSHPSIRRYRDARPQGRLAVVLTGTDLYRDLPRGSKLARESLHLADRLIVLQQEALKALPWSVRAKARVVYQSTNTKLRQAPPKAPFRIAVVGHLREVKDPFRAVKALRLLEGDYEVVHVGGALDPEMVPVARQWMRREPRYRWTGSLSHGETLHWIARSHLLVVSSAMEGGANVIVEAARIGTPVLASRVPGNIGMLGRGYPGYFPLYDERALAKLIGKSAVQKEYHGLLKRALAVRRRLFSPATERRTLLRALRMRK